MNIFSLVPEIQYFPKEWQTVPFDKAFKDVTGGNAKIKLADYKNKGLLPVIDQGKEHIGGYVDDLSLHCQVPLPVVLFGDHTKVFKFVTVPFALGADGVKVLVPSPNLDARFAYYYLQLVRFPADTGYSRHFKYLKEITVPIPPRDEQLRITDILDRADDLRHKRKESIRLTEDFLRSLFLDIFGDPVTNPKRLDVGRLGDYSEMETGYAFRSEYFQNQGVRLCRGANVLPGVVEWSDVVLWDGSDRSIPEKYVLEEGDIVLAMDRPWISSGLKVARIRSSDLPCYLVQRVARIRGIRGLTTDYIYYSILHPAFTKHCLPRKTETTIPHIAPHDIRSYPILIPSKKEISLFSEFAKKSLRLIDNQTKTATGAEDLLKSLTQRAFKGEL